MIRAWLAERFRPELFLPLAMVIAAAAAGWEVAPGPFAIDLVAALLLLAEFRLWDDLADRPADRLTHPHRSLVRASSTRVFVRVCLMLAGANLVWTIGQAGVGISLAVLVGLHVALGRWYWRRTARTIAGDQLRLVKYPAFALVLAGSRLEVAPLAITLSAAAIYTGASIYEAWHDPVSPLGARLGGRS